MKDGWMNMALYRPAIPANTGNISRMCVGLNIHLHLIEPLGFSIDDRELKRAGLDHWRDLKLSVHKNFEAYLEVCRPVHLYAVTKFAEREYTSMRYESGGHLLLGNENDGLSDVQLPALAVSVSIPMPGPVRSLNLSNAAAVVAYEAYRQLKAKSD